MVNVERTSRTRLLSVIITQNKSKVMLVVQIHFIENIKTEIISNCHFSSSGQRNKYSLYLPN